MTSSLVREPKQERSRVSFDRAVDAALSLLVERGTDAFTLAEVAVRAGVSTGSIYGRVDSKENLIRAVVDREMSRIAREQHLIYDDFDPTGESLAGTVDHAVRSMSEFLRANAAVIAPFTAVGSHDDQVAHRGKTHFAELVDDFIEFLSPHPDIQHPDPRQAARWSHTVVYSVVARWLGIGSEQEAAGEGDWQVILSNLSEMVTAFLEQPAA